MATIDAVMSDKRAKDVIDKYRERLHGVSALASEDDLRAIVTEMQSDIANAINAAVSEATRTAGDGHDMPTVPQDDGDRSQYMAAKGEATPGNKPEQAPGSTQSPARGGGRPERAPATHMPATGHGKRG